MIFASRHHHQHICKGDYWLLNFYRKSLYPDTRELFLAEELAPCSRKFLPANP
jgi:hypothetical protein